MSHSPQHYLPCNEESVLHDVNMDMEWSLAHNLELEIPMLGRVVAADVSGSYCDGAIHFLQNISVCAMM
jgi:hypothetical protein